MAKYSVIMPIYNKEAYVEKSIKSVQNQDCCDWEIIAVDDESKDRSLEIVQRLAVEDSRIKVFAIKNEGVSNARNFALSKASAEYVTFLDADDTFNACLFKKYDEILAECDADIVFTDFSKVNENYDLLETVRSGIDVGAYSAEEIMPRVAKIQDEIGFFGFVTNKLVRRSIIADNQIEFDRKLKLCEDLDFYIRVYEKANTFYFSNFESFNYVQNVPGSSIAAKVDYYSQIQIYLKLKNMLISRGVTHEKNGMLDQMVSLYIACYITEQIPESCKAFCEKQKRLYSNKEAMASITTRSFPFIRKILLSLAKAKMCRVQYFILKTKMAVGRLIRR